jgi:hypothetical protein
MGATLAAVVVMGVVAPSQAGWLSKLIEGAERAGARTAAHGLHALDGAARHIKNLPRQAEGGAVLAAQAMPEGHWRFVNQAGETFTAGTPEEVRRAGSVLVPEAKANAHLVVYVTEDTIFSYRAALHDLPKGTELHVVVGSDSYRVLRRGAGAGEQFYAEISPGLVVRLSDAKAFAEAVWQLARPLNKANVRVLALEPDGPSVLASAPRIDPASGRALIDVIDPASLAGAMRAVRGQTLLVTGRIEGGLLHVQPASGAERSVPLGELFKAAEEGDVNLIVLRATSTPRQPGGRNWFWQKIQVKGLDEALQRARLADFLDGLAGPGRRFEAVAAPSGRLRATLELEPVDLPAATGSRPLGDIVSDMVADITGNIVFAGARANMQSSERQREIDTRIIPGVPSGLQISYLIFFAFGMLGVPISRRWWQRIWPPESRSEYAGALGYWLARLVRGGAFLLVFLPLTAPASMPLALLKQVWDMLMAPVRAWRWLASWGRGPARQVQAGARRAADAGPGDWPTLDRPAVSNRFPNR